MARRYIIPKLNLEMESFFCKKWPHDYTVKELQQIVRDNGRVPKGNKDDLIKMIQSFWYEEGGRYLRSSYPSVGPGWFFYDEVCGFGDHKPYFICVCGEVTCLPDAGFSITATGMISPSLACPHCGWHPWGHLAKFPMEFEFWKYRTHAYLGSDHNWQCDPSLKAAVIGELGVTQDRPYGPDLDLYIEKYKATIGKAREDV